MRNTIQDYAVPFAAWDVRLYLDTHPNDAYALSVYRQLCAQSCASGSYACVPDQECGAERWRWIDDPWPWEPEANCPVSCPTACRANRSAPNSYARRG